MKTRTEVLEVLRSLKAELRERYHVESIALFGSYAREEQGEGSDIDVLVEFGSGADLFDFILQGVKGAEQEDPGLQTGDESGAALLI
ncbi:MAG: uncharacterized protein PWQ69_1624 [Methanomicrobiaceae archaeon]|nr:uncharacterized protein [Methanomicrobiaceae archaeon]